MPSINGESLKEKARTMLKQHEPKVHRKGFLIKKSELETMPKTYMCEKHGQYLPYIGDTMFGEKVMYGTACNQCVKEFDLMVDEKVKELELEQEAAAQKARSEKRIEMLSLRGVSKRYIGNTFDTYIYINESMKSAHDACRSLCERIKADGESNNIIMIGGVGTGKTHLANSMVIDLYDSKRGAKRINMIDMIRHLKSAWSKDSEYTEAEVIDFYANVDLLVIDEVGVQFNSDTEKMFIFDIINGRYDNCLPTVIISNLDLDGVKSVIGDRCVDRLREDNGKVLAFNWESHRGKK